MKKALLTLTLLCVALTLHALDYRQVIFGNSYENIIEINADDFFEQYPEVKELYRANYLYHHDESDLPSINARPNYFKVYEQVIGSEIFYRVLMSFDQYTNSDLLDWNDIFFTQYVFYKESEKNLLQLGDEILFGKDYFSQDRHESFQGLEIIQRDDVVIGLLWHEVLFLPVGNLTYRGPSPISNKAIYCLWNGIQETKGSVSDTISYALWYEPSTEWYESESDIRKETTEGIGITVSSKDAEGYYYSCDVFVDSKRPFLYSIQNAFDGNPATIYVENSLDNFFYLRIQAKSTKFMIINGYADGDYYAENNQIKEIVFYNFEGENKLLLLKDTMLPQEYSISPQRFGFEIGVTQITPGTKYTDTSLAELDIYIDGIGWLFGGL